MLLPIRLKPQVAASYPLYTTPTESYFNIISPLTLKPLKIKNLDLDDGTEEYLNTLDKNIERLTLSNRNITSIFDFIHFSNLIKLDISRTKIRDISYIPETVEVFICRSNFLIVCPPLNESLKVLDLGDNLIKDMPEFTSKLEYVDVDNNGLKLFRNFNHGLLYLSARNNNLTMIPLIPDTLRVLQIDNNRNLKKIPILPESLDICSIKYTDIYDDIVIFYHDFNIIFMDEYVMERYNMECIKNYIKMINENIINNRLWFRRYIWHIREKVIKMNFSPDKLKIHLDTFESEQNHKPETAEWFDEMIDNWNSKTDHIFDKQHKYTRTNDQMYEDLQTFYMESPYLFNTSRNIVVGDFDNDEYYSDEYYNDYERYEFDNESYDTEYNGYCFDFYDF